MANSWSPGRSCVLATVALALIYLLSCAQVATRPERAANRAPSSRGGPMACPVPANKGLPSLHAKDPTFSYCAQFISPDCSAGELGEAMRGYFEPTGLAAFVRDPPEQVLTYCPAYATLDEETRERFWIWTVMSIAYEEGGCGEPSVVQAVRDYYAKHRGTAAASAVAADGTYALPWEDKHRKGRSEFCSNARIAADAESLGEIAFPGETGAKKGALAASPIAGPKAGARCAMAMLAKQLRKTGKLNDRGSYWEKLRKSGSSLFARLPKFRPCEVE